MVSHSELRNLFCSADAVCFDVDSTVIQEEGIDELAKFCGVEDAVSEMTRQAMGGAVPFKAALTQRLALIQPSREQVQRLLAEHPPHLTPGIRELVSRLQERNVQVFLISGGFRSIVEHVASKLNIPSTNVFANRLKFYFNGEYAGFDETQPTAESGGKGKVIKLLKEKFHFKKIVMVGDGATDMEACPPADAFIGFGGNVIRQQVKDNAECIQYFRYFKYSSRNNLQARNPGVEILLSTEVVTAHPPSAPPLGAVLSVRDGSPFLPSWYLSHRKCYKDFFKKGNMEG
uniref:Phosphoserine phosphatase n=1 Tax=Bos indicus x Bos taurus TaxID=30522 RepID=A0A4W2BRB2_BOBOX